MQCIFQDEANKFWGKSRVSGKGMYKVCTQKNPSSNCRYSANTTKKLRFFSLFSKHRFVLGGAVTEIFPHVTSLADFQWVRFSTIDPHAARWVSFRLLGKHAHRKLYKYHAIVFVGNRAETWKWFWFCCCVVPLFWLYQRSFQ